MSFSILHLGPVFRPTFGPKFISIELGPSAAVSTRQTVDYLEMMLNGSKPSTLMLSPRGNHEELMAELSQRPLLFSEINLWIMSQEYEPNLPLRLDSKVLLYSGNEADGYSLYDSYAIGGRAPKTALVMRWHSGNGTVEHFGGDGIFSLESRSDLGGSVVRFSWFNYPPFVRLVGDGSGAVISAVGFYPDILNELQARLNFSPEYVAARPREKWGAKTANGTWNGMMGE